LTVAVSCNVSEGVILGVDSAVTISHPEGGVVKIYEHAEKLFQLAQKPIGIASFGIGALGARNIGSFIREFEILNPNKVVTQPSTIKTIVEELRSFFLQQYQKTIVPVVEKQKKKKFDEIPNDEKPVLGFVVGGFSHDEYLSEVWEILIPFHATPNSAKLCRDKGDFGSNWFSLFAPIQRYVKGMDRRLFEELIKYFTQIRGSDFTKDEKKKISQILAKYEYQIPFAAMPMQEGVAHVKFLVEMVVNHHRFAVGAPVVGGEAHIGLVTYKGENFQILE
jgi:hypothetical protein